MSARTEPLDPVHRKPSRGRFAALLGAVLLVSGMLPPASAQEKFRPIIAETKGKGPGEQVVAFSVNPDVYAPEKKPRQFLSAPTLQAISDETFGARQDRQEQVVRQEGWDQFNLCFGLGAAGGTLAENVAMFSGLSNVNNAMTNLGLFLTIWQVNLDLANGDNSAAGRSAYKGLMGFAAGKWGWSALQSASVIWFVVDVTLSEFGKAAWFAREDYWRKVYAAYYSDGDRNARSGELGPRSGYLSPTLEEKVRDIRFRTEGGRTVNEWKILISHYFGRARSADRFAALLENELDLYAARFWTSPRFEEYAADTGGGTAGLAKGASLTDEIKRTLEDEHKARLMAMIVKKIFPEIAHKAWVEGLEKEVARLNRETVPELNSTIDIDVSAYELTAPARFSMPKPSGGQWSGTLNPGQTRTLKITKLAYIRAGLPDEVILEGSSGLERKKIRFSDDRGTVTFGAPESTLVTVLDRTETGLSCTIRRTVRSGETSTVKENRDVSLAPVVHTAVSADLGRMLLGKFDPSSGWVTASPGAPQPDGSIGFAAPTFEDIVEMTECSPAFLKGDVLSGGTCRVKRRKVEKTPEGTEIDTTCFSSATFSVKGLYMPQGGALQYVPLDGPQGETMRNVLRESMKKGFAGPGVPK